LGFLKREKSRVEQHALLLRTVEKTDPAVYEHGIELYMDGKADFDELIEELKVGLIAGQDPARSAKFAATLQEAAEKEIAFTAFVKREVADKLKGARAGLPDVANAVAGLLKTITDATLSIWKAYRDNATERRDAILNELRRMRTDG
jgi:hypothetical protein